MDSGGTSRGGGGRGGSRGGRGSFNRGRGRNSRNNGVIRSNNSTGHDDETTNDTNPEVSPHGGLEAIQIADNHHDGESSQARPLTGSNFVEQTAPSSYREKIWLEGNEFNTSQADKKIVKNFKNMYNGPWATWPDVDPDSRKRMWERFLNMFTWDHDIM